MKWKCLWFWQYIQPRPWLVLLRKSLCRWNISENDFNFWYGIVNEHKVAWIYAARAQIGTGTFSDNQTMQSALLVLRPMGKSRLICPKSQWGDEFWRLAAGDQFSAKVCRSFRYKAFGYLMRRRTADIPLFWRDYRNPLRPRLLAWAHNQRHTARPRC